MAGAVSAVAGCVANDQPIAGRAGPLSALRPVRVAQPRAMGHGAPGSLPVVSPHDPGCIASHWKLALHWSPAAQAPQVPPQPSSPQTRPVHWRVQPVEPLPPTYQLKDVAVKTSSLPSRAAPATSPQRAPALASARRSTFAAFAMFSRMGRRTVIGVAKVIPCGCSVRTGVDAVKVAGGKSGGRGPE